MTATIRESNANSDLYLCVLGKLNAITNPNGSGRWIYSEFPEKKIDKETSYPLVVLDSPEFSYAPLTFTSLKRGPTRVTVDIYSTTGQQLDSISDSIIDKFESD